MKKAKRIAIIILALMLICAVFVACNDKNKADVNGEQPTQKVERKPTADPNPYNSYDVAVDAIDWRTTTIKFQFERMIITFTNSESLNNLFYDYTLEDFDTEKFVDVCEVYPEELMVMREKVTANDFGVERREFTRSLWLTLKNPSRENVLQYVDEFRMDKGIRYASPEVHNPAGWFATTNDELIDHQQSVFEKIELFDAWDTTTGSSNVMIKRKRR